MEVAMSALGLDDVDEPRGVLAYAPRRQTRRDDETSIRPVLERLSRTDGPRPGPRLVRQEPVRDLPPQVEMVAKSAFPMTARLALAAGVLVLVGAAGAGYLTPTAANHAAPQVAAAAPSALPKPVQTVAIQRPADVATEPTARIVKDDARVEQPAKAAVVAQPKPPAAAADPSTTPLRAWAAMPAATTGSGWTSDQLVANPVRSVSADAAAPVETTPPKPAPAEVAHKPAPTHRTTHHAARHRNWQHRRRHTARAQAAEQNAQPARTEAVQTQPVKKLPLQAAIDRLFGASKASTATVPPPSQQ
jgi:hypothetical protein